MTNNNLVKNETKHLSTLQCSIRVPPSIRCHNIYAKSQEFYKNKSFELSCFTKQKMP